MAGMLRGKGKPQPPNKSGKPGKEDTEPATRAPRTLDAPHRTAPGGQLSSTSPAPHRPCARAHGHQGRDQPGTANPSRDSNRNKETSNPTKERDPPGTANPSRESNRSPQEPIFDDTSSEDRPTRVDLRGQNPRRPAWMVADDFDSPPIRNPTREAAAEKPYRSPT